jgi:AraC-like DNA-binding protein/mannose-6-phosphate isomerase-like protein (cupin superfamily)
MSHGAAAAYTLALPEWGVPFIEEVDWQTSRPSRRHAHQDIQTLWILSGTMFVQFGPRRFAFRPGGVCVIASGLAHSVSQRNDRPAVTFLDLRLSPRSPLAQFVALLSGQQAFTCDADNLRQRAKELRAASRASGARKPPRIMSCVWDLFASLSANETQALAAAESTAADTRLARADAFINDSLSHALSVAGIAAHVGVSRSQLTRLYMQAMQIGPAQRLQQLRVAKARQLLQRSTLTIKEIAHACGFVCPNHFCRIFREHAKATPTQFRRRGEMG